MDESEEDSVLRDQGVIKTVASPATLAAILKDSLEDKQSSNISSYEENCLSNTSNDINHIISNEEMDGKQIESTLNDSLVADSLEYDLHGSFEEEVVDDDASDKHSQLNDSLLSSSASKISRESTCQLHNKTTNQKTTPKQRAKQTNFIDLNKGKLNRAAGKSSYAAIYSQKLKNKKENSNPKEDINAGNKSLKETKAENQTTSRTSSNLSQQNRYSSLKDTSSSISGYDTLHEKTNYYNVDPSYLQSSTVPNYGAPMEYPDYFNQPYHAPYRDFGLRYSNYGHQTYMTATRPTNVHQGYSSQSAPAAAPRQSLLSHVEFFPEQEHLLSRSLTNSQFINPMQLYQTSSVLDRRFVSEPQLELVTIPEKNKGMNNEENNTPRKTLPDYKPYTLKDYKQFKNERHDKYGGLGPETESEEYKEKMCKLNKQREYAEMLRIDHAAKKKQWTKKPAANEPPARQQQAEAKRQAAINYAKSIPRPKIVENSQKKDLNEERHQENEGNVPLIEVLRMRHIQEKRQVEVMKKQLQLSKTQ